MNTSEDFTITVNENFNRFILSNSFDTTLIANNPSLKVLYQQAVIAEQNKKVRNGINIYPILMWVISTSR
jgi:cobalt-zinc-cadmium resistance protein CzcA